MVHNFVMRILPQFEEGNNVDPVGFKFDIMYYTNLVLTDGIVYDSFDKCLDSLSGYLKRLHSRKGIQPFVVDIRDL